MKSVAMIAQVAYEIGSELWREWRRKRAADKAARAWAERPNEPKGCKRCNTLNYLGGSVCSNCGWPL